METPFHDTIVALQQKVLLTPGPQAFPPVAAPIELAPPPVPCKRNTLGFNSRSFLQGCCPSAAACPGVSIPPTPSTFPTAAAAPLLKQQLPVADVHQLPHSYEVSFRPVRPLC